jgi:hypothetical protein
MSDRVLKAYEIILCAAVFVVSVALLILVARAMWPEHA